MAVQFVTYNDDTMQPGKFYSLRVNLDQATALIEETITTQTNLSNMTLYETTGNIMTELKFFKEINTSYGIGHEEVDVHKLYLPGDKIQVRFNPPFTGVVIKK